MNKSCTVLTNVRKTVKHCVLKFVTQVYEQCSVPFLLIVENNNFLKRSGLSYQQFSSTLNLLFNSVFPFCCYFCIYFTSPHKAIACFRILLRNETEMFESLHDILNNYFPDIVDEHILKALNRIDWLPVYERVRVDITNFKFWEKLENKTIILHTL